MIKHNTDCTKEKEDGYSALDFYPKKGAKRRKLKSALLLIFNIAVIAIIIIVEIFTNHERVDISTVLSVWGENRSFFVLLFGLVALYFVLLAAKLNVLIRAMTNESHFKLALSTVVLGKYYDNITPFGSGGQPFQMFNLGKKLDVGLATSIPIADFILGQMSFVIIAIIVCIVYPLSGNDFLRITAYIGIVAFAIVPIAVIAFSVFPSAITATAKFFCKIGHKLRLVKDLERAESKAESGVMRYCTSLRTVAKKWWALVISGILSGISWWVLCSLPYVVLRVCGINADYFDTVCMCFYVYSAITVVPTPGNAGAAEGAFYSVFRPLSGGFLFWGTALWRFCVYYLTLIMGFSVTVYQYIRPKCKKRTAYAETSESVDDLIDL